MVAHEISAKMAVLPAKMVSAALAMFTAKEMVGEFQREFPHHWYEEGRRQVAFLVAGLTLSARGERDSSSHNWG